MIVQIQYCSFVLLIILVTCHEICGKKVEPNSPFSTSRYKNQYGEDYGKKWIFFPNGDGVPQFVNLTSNELTDNQSYLRKEFYSDMEYRLYKSGDKENYTILNDDGEPLEEIDDILKSFHVKPLKVLTHGWKSSVDNDVVEVIKNAYLETQDVYVITVDWSYIADSIFYHWVANETKTIGRQLSSFLDAIHYRYNVSGVNIHMIGHSLGAHVMGIAASSTTLTIDRVTGLDPARPLFEYPSREDIDKLDFSDATFVDVIHTCGGVLGIVSAVGVADFYPNNGTPPQPGCESMQKVLEACSHSRSYYYYAESIRYPEAFPAYQCGNWTNYLENRCIDRGYMGEKVNRNVKGKLFLKTYHKPPFGRRT